MSCACWRQGCGAATSGFKSSKPAMVCPQADFIQRYENDALEETLEFAEWIGEYRLRERLLEKAAAVRAIWFAD